MRDLNPSPGVWVPDDGGWLSTPENTEIGEFVVEAEMGEAVVVHNPDDAIVIRYAGELYRRARAVQVAVTRWNAVITDPLRRADIADRERSSEEIRKAEAGLYALLDEMRREAGDG